MLCYYNIKVMVNTCDGEYVDEYTYALQHLPSFIKCVKWTAPRMSV